METSYSSANHAVFHAQNYWGGLGHLGLVILSYKSLFFLQKPQMRAGTDRDLQFWC